MTRPRRPHRVCSRYGVRATCGRSARVTNAEWQGALRCISGRGDGEGGFVAGGTLSGAIPSRGDVPCVVHDTCTACVHCGASGREISGDRMAVASEGGPPRALVLCSCVCKRLQGTWGRVGTR